MTVPVRGLGPGTLFHMLIAQRPVLRYIGGMPVAASQKVSALAEDFGSLRRLADALGVDPAQVSRWARGGGIDAKNAARLDLLELAVSAVARLYEPEVMEDWLFGLNPALADRRPIDVIRAGDLPAVLCAIRAEEGESFA